MLTRKLRTRATLAAAALYALCVLAPNAALAFGNGSAHCLTDASPAAHVHTKASAKSHVHSDGSVHVHETTKASHHANASGAAPSDKADKKHGDTNCCGLFCISAIAASLTASLDCPPKVTTGHFGHVYQLAGRGPVLINRPPIG